MDPQTTWDELLSAFTAGDFAQIEELALALREWLRRGGFPPVVLGHGELGPEFDRALAEAGCDFILRLVCARWTTEAAKGESP